eukprot:2319982-Pyramimonas_sp.AAC.1
MAAQDMSQPRACDARDTEAPRVGRNRNMGRPGVSLALGSRAQASPARVRKCGSTVAWVYFKCSPGKPAWSKCSASVVRAQSA